MIENCETDIVNTSSEQVQAALPAAFTAVRGGREGVVTVSDYFPERTRTERHKAHKQTQPNNVLNFDRDFQH